MLLNEILDRNVRNYPQKDGMVFNGRHYAYEEIGDKVNRFSNALPHLGIHKGDRVALFLRGNSPEYLINYFGIFQNGSVAVPVNSRLKTREVEYILNDSDTKVLVFDKEYLDIVEELRSRLKMLEHCIMLGEEGCPDGILNYQTLLNHTFSKRPATESDENDVAVQMYTSGTTGFPKGAMLSHRNLVTGLFLTALTARFHIESRSLNVAPFFHIGGALMTMTTILVGGVNIILEGFDPINVLETISRQKITHAGFVPTMLKMIVNVPAKEDYDLSSLETVGSGAAALDLKLLSDCRRLFKCRFVNTLGLTEASAAITIMTEEEYKLIEKDPENLAYLLGSVGKESQGIHIRIIDEYGRDVPQGEMGEIIVRGDNVMKGYYKMPEKTEEALRGGWFYTGDIGRFDKDRYLYIADRKKDMIISGGENIYTLEVENVLRELNGVTEAAVVGIPHEKWREVPKAFVVQRSNVGLTEEKVIEFCKKNLAGFKCPKVVAFVDALPHNAAGKVLKTQLRSLDS
jgi:acyl-CoA synthetase (AMP-forming)/AMP-acid ligase II